MSIEPIEPTLDVLDLIVNRIIRRAHVTTLVELHLKEPGLAHGACGGFSQHGGQIELAASRLKLTPEAQELRQQVGAEPWRAVMLMDEETRAWTL